MPSELCAPKFTSATRSRCSGAWSRETRVAPGKRTIALLQGNRFCPCNIISIQSVPSIPSPHLRRALCNNNRCSSPFANRASHLSVSSTSRCRVACQNTGAIMPCPLLKPFHAFQLQCRKFHSPWAEAQASSPVTSLPMPWLQPL